VASCEKRSILKKSSLKKVLVPKNKLLLFVVKLGPGKQGKIEQIGHKEAEQLNEERMNSCGSM